MTQIRQPTQLGTIPGSLAPVSTLSRSLSILTARVTMRAPHLGGTWAEVLRYLDIRTSLSLFRPPLASSHPRSTSLQTHPTDTSQAQIFETFRGASRASDEHCVTCIQALEIRRRPGSAPSRHGISREHRKGTSGIHLVSPRTSRSLSRV